MPPLLLKLLVLLPPILLALTVHEWAHAWSADRLGDPTARLQGRLTLNPLAHLDPIGTVVLAVTLLQGFAFGWAKPVPVDTRRLAHPRRDLFWIAGAGPASNLLQALIFGTVIRLGGHERFLTAYANWSQGYGLNTMGEILMVMVFLAFIVNIFLAWFNLIPLPPLDGSKILLRFLTPRATAAYLQVGRYGVLILFGMLLLPGFRDLFWMILGPPVTLTGYIFGGVPLM
jgi:Zn-dependent protease